MNKFISIFLVLTITILSGCASPRPPVPEPKFVTSVKSENKSEIASISVKPVWQSANLFTEAGIYGFSLHVKNNTNKIAKIVWEKSSISYGGNSHTLFVEGQRFIDASKPSTATVLPAMGSMNKNIYSSTQPFFTTGAYGGWRMNTIEARKVVIVLCVESGDVVEFFTVEIAG